MASNEKFCLRWNDFEKNIGFAFRDIREEKDFFDCTLSCGAKQIQAHKLILSACSPFFHSILKQNPHQHPLLYLKGVEFNNLQSVLNFMYHGEVNVAQEELNSFLSVAEDLQIKGLTQNNSSEPSKPEPAGASATPTIKSTPLPRQPEATPHKYPQTLPQVEAFQQNEKLWQSSQQDLQEIMPIVKTEPQPASSIPHTPTPQNTLGLYREEGMVENMSREVASMDGSYVEEEWADYAEYEGQGHYTGNSSGNEIESCIGFRNDMYECTVCGKGFPMKKTCRRHIQTVHTDNQQVVCHVCNKQMKNNASLKTHLRGTHGVYQK